MMRRRLVWLVLALVLAVGGFLSWSSYRHTTRLYRQEVENRLLDNAAWLGEMLIARSVTEADTLWLEPGAFDEQARYFAQRLAVDHTGRYEQGLLRITLIREDGVVIGDSEADSRTMENHAGRPEILMARAEGRGSDERMSSSVGVPYLYHARWFPSRKVSVRLALPLQALLEIRQRTVRTGLMAMAVSLLLAGLLARLLSRVVTEPVMRLSRQLSAMDHQHPHLRLQAPGDQELGLLTRNVNTLAERLEASVTALGDRNAEMDTIIGSLTTGLVAVDRNMCLLMANPVVFDLFGVKLRVEFLGKPVVELFRNTTLLSLLEAAVRDGCEETRETTLFDGDKRMLQIHVCPIRAREGETGNGGALAHVVDVTAVRRLEEMRSQFVSNVTHELKTPLTSIRGFVETLRAGALSDERMASRFLEIIDLEVERLSGLIEDILSLAEIEGMKTEPVCEPVPLRPLVAEVMQLLAGAAAERGITLSQQVPQGLSLLAGRSRVKQLLLNLVDNAIKYNRENGSVTVSAEPHGQNRVAIRVTDTGIGIPEAYRERVFERFYRVDRGRTRARGGTGLGLSIVKHIAHLYGGAVELESETGQGSTFVVILPEWTEQPREPSEPQEQQDSAEPQEQPDPAEPQEQQDSAEPQEQPDPAEPKEPKELQKPQ